MFTRRRTIGLLVVAPAPLFLPSCESVLAGHESQMRRSLAGLQLPFSPARLDLVGFSLDQSKGNFHMVAVVRMTWAPGLRQRRFETAQNDPDRAIAALVEQIGTRFSAAA